MRGSGNVGWGGIISTNNSDGVVVDNIQLGGTSQEFSIVQPYEIVGYMWIRRS